MILGREFGSKTGGGMMATPELVAANRKERLKRMALEKIDLKKDPYFMRNHLGQFECRLCLTLHPDEANYLAHTQGKRHQENLAKRAAHERLASSLSTDAANTSTSTTPATPAVQLPTIGRPGYRVTKGEDEDGAKTLTFEIEYPEIAPNTKPLFRIMSSYEQRVETPDGSCQYVLFAASPYTTVGFRVPNAPVEKGTPVWDSDRTLYTVKIRFLLNRETKAAK